MPPIVIPFTSNDLGRILFNAHVSTSDSKSLKRVNFKLDYGSDFTTLSCEDLDILGYSYEYLKNCPAHEDGASLAADEVNVPVQYITNVSIKFGDRELQHCRVWRTLIMAKSEARLFSEAGAVKLGEISQNNDIYTAFLKFQGRVYKQSAAVALEFFAQKPHLQVQFIASEKQWQAAGYKVKRGGEAIHFVDGNGIKNDLFDFSQVEGNSYSADTYSMAICFHRTILALH